MCEAVEDELILEVELPRLVRHAEDDDRAGFDVGQDERVQVAHVRIVVVRRDRHAPAIGGGYAFVSERTSQRRRVLAVDTPHQHIHLLLEMSEADRVRKAAALDHCLHRTTGRSSGERVAA